MTVSSQTESALTVVIPTRNRPVFLNRLMKYYRSQATKHRTIIADSSDAELYEESRQSLAPFEGQYPVDHLQFPAEISFESKLQQAYARVETPFVVTGSDDDFHIPKALQTPQCS
jgi:glycosyltransferase domain-containing protein